MRRRTRRPSAALVIACAALLVALSGTSAASVSQSLLPNSVGEIHLRASAVTSEKVKDETLQSIDLSPRARGALTGPIGPAGPAGPQGAKGDPGAPGITGLEIVEAQSPSSSKNGKLVRAFCRGGRRVLAGGAEASRYQIEGDVIALNGSWPFRGASASGGRDRDGWVAKAIEQSPSNPDWSLTVYAICAFVD